MCFRGLLIAKVDGMGQYVARFGCCELGKRVCESVPVLLGEEGGFLDVDDLGSLEVVELVGVEVEGFNEVVLDYEVALLVDIDVFGWGNQVSNVLVEAFAFADQASVEFSFNILLNFINLFKLSLT